MHYAGKELTTRFRDVRQALAYSLSMLRGPQRRRMRWDDSPRVQGSPEAASAVRAILRGDLGIQPGDNLWRAIESHVFDGEPLTEKTTAVMRRIRALLGQAGLLDDQGEAEVVKLDLEDVVFVDEVTGMEMTMVREAR